MERKRDILMESFNILSKNIEKNYDRIKDIIIKVIDIEEETAIEMWSHLLNHPSYTSLNDWAKENFSGYLVGLLKDKKGAEYLIDLLSKNDKLACELFIAGRFEFSTVMSQNFVEAFIVPCFEMNRVALIEMMYEGFSKNKNIKLADAIEKPLERFFDYNDHLSPETANLIANYLEYIRNKEAKARISVLLVDYL